MVHPVRADRHSVPTELAKTVRIEAAARSDPTGDHEERPDEATVEQRPQADVEVRCVPVVEADPNVRPSRDGVQDPVERVDRDPVAVLARLQRTPRRADRHGNRCHGRPSPRSSLPFVRRPLDIPVVLRVARHATHRCSTDTSRGCRLRHRTGDADRCRRRSPSDGAACSPSRRQRSDHPWAPSRPSKAGCVAVPRGQASALAGCESDCRLRGRTLQSPDELRPEWQRAPEASRARMPLG